MPDVKTVRSPKSWNALESYEVREAGREPALAFYTRLSAQSGTDIDLEATIRAHRHPHQGVDL
ncbi:hypothetical protein GCM10023067_54680 [Aminobacter aganoensis]